MLKKRNLVSTRIYTLHAVTFQSAPLERFTLKASQSASLVRFTGKAFQSGSLERFTGKVFQSAPLGTLHRVSIANSK